MKFLALITETLDNPLYLFTEFEALDEALDDVRRVLTT